MLKGGRWYLVAARPDRADPATYRVSQILDLTPLDEPFERPEFDLPAWWRAHVVQFRAGLHRDEASIRLSPRGFARLREIGAHVGVVAMLDSYPTDVWRGEPDPGEGGALKALIAIAGHDPDRLPQLALNRASVLAFLRATDSPLGRLPDAALDGVVRVVAGNNRMVRGHFHLFYDGTVTHFRAALDHQGRDLSPDRWKAYAARVEVIDIPSLHAHLTGPEATALIAPVLSEALAAAEQEAICATAV